MSKKNLGRGRKWTVICFVTLAFLFLALGVVMCEAGRAVQQAEELSSAVLRLHIVANSDSQEDQSLKLRVRDAMAQEVERMLSGQQGTKEQVRSVVEDNIELLEEIGNTVVRQAGKNYTVTASVRKKAFPTREYLDLSLPAWDYDCLYVTIGDAVGRNWWCILFPQLCFKEGIVGKLEPESREYLEDNLSDDTYDMITVNAEEKPVRVQVRFKIVEIIQGIREAFRRD